MLENIPLWTDALHSRASGVAPSPPEFHKMALPLEHHSALPAHMALCCSPTHRTPCRGGILHACPPKPERWPDPLKPMRNWLCHLGLR